MENKIAAVRLKAIRESLGLSLQKVADLMDMKLSSYRHYEDRYKGSSLPAEVVDKLLVAFKDYPEVKEDILDLISLSALPVYDLIDTRAIPEGFGHPQVHFLAMKMAKEVTIQSDGTKIQVLASVDKEGIDRLIEKLKIARDLLD